MMPLWQSTACLLYTSPPGRTKFITAKKLSKKLEKEQVLTALSQNIQLAVTIQPSSEKKPDKIRKLVDIQANVAAGKGLSLIHIRCV